MAFLKKQGKLDEDAYRRQLKKLMHLTRSQHIRADKTLLLEPRVGFKDSVADFFTKCLYFKDITLVDPVSRNLKRFVGTGRYKDWLSLDETWELYAHLCTVLSQHRSPAYRENMSLLVENLRTLLYHSGLQMFLRKKTERLKEILRPDYLYSLYNEFIDSNANENLVKEMRPSDRRLVKQLVAVYGELRSCLPEDDLHDRLVIDVRRDKFSMRDLLKSVHVELRECCQHITRLKHICDEIFLRWADENEQLSSIPPYHKQFAMWRKDFLLRLQHFWLTIKVLIKDINYLRREFSVRKKPDGLKLLERLYRDKLKHRIKALRSQDTDTALTSTYTQVLTRLLRESVALSHQRKHAKSNSEGLSSIDNKLLEHILSIDKLFLMNGEELEQYLRQYEDAQERLQEVTRYLSPFLEESTWDAYINSNAQLSLNKNPKTPPPPPKDPALLVQYQKELAQLAGSEQQFDSAHPSFVQVKAAHNERLAQLRREAQNLDRLFLHTSDVIDLHLFSAKERTEKLFIQPLLEDLEREKNVLVEAQVAWEENYAGIHKQWIESMPNAPQYAVDHFLQQMESIQKSYLFVLDSLIKELGHVVHRLHLRLKLMHAAEKPLRIA